MKKLYLLLPILFLIYWGCEDEKPEEQDTTPPTITITSTQNNTSVSELVTITCISSDNEGVEKVELWVNGVSTGIIDETEPYSLEWNTLTYDDGSYGITVRSYDTSGNTTDSELITLVVYKTVELWGKFYSIENTTVLNLSYSGLTGSIPPEIGNLTNLTQLWLCCNELTGEIPIEICNLNIGEMYYFSIYNNQLCPPYPSCIEDYVGEQNCVECDESNEVELWGQCYNIETTTHLELSNISGEIPPEIGNLINLTYLNIEGNSNNYLIGEIPSSIGNLNNLTGLWLFNNQLSGEIPSEIGNLSNLETLKLENNLLSGNIPDEICDLSLLIENFGTWLFDISGNQLCPPYPSCIEDYVGDQDLSNCDGVVELWGEYYSIENTIELDLSYSGLTGSIPPEIGSLTNLERLELYGNELSGSIPPEIGNLTNLTFLDLSDNELSGSIPPEIGNLTNLTELKLVDNQLTGSIPPEIGNLTNLTQLWLCCNELTGEIPIEICNLNIGEMYYFSIYNNQLCPPYPSCIEDYVGDQDLSNCDGVVELWGEYYSIENTIELDLSYSGLTGSIPPEIGSLTNLERLELYGNELTGSIPPEIGNLTNLTYLNLDENELTGSIPSEIGNLTNLTFLDLSDNELTGSIPTEIGNLTNLTSLNLGNNQLTGSIPPEIGNLTNLTYLNLDENELTGSIPSEIWNLTNLTFLDLSDNELTGSIQPEIGNLTNLEWLSLDNNQLTGSIPPEIGNLTYLRRLYLNGNQLSGSIPPEIGNLTNLEILSLYNNQLTGEIPESICDIDWSNSEFYINISYNQLCPPYQSCIEDYVGYQDTSDCP